MAKNKNSDSLSDSNVPDTDSPPALAENTGATPDALVPSAAVPPRDAPSKPEAQTAVIGGALREDPAVVIASAKPVVAAVASDAEPAKASSDHPALIFGDKENGPVLEEKWVVITPRKTESFSIGKTSYSIVEDVPCKVPEHVKVFLQERKYC